MQGGHHDAEQYTPTTFRGPHASALIERDSYITKYTKYKIFHQVYNVYTTKFTTSISPRITRIRRPPSEAPRVSFDNKAKSHKASAWQPLDRHSIKRLPRVSFVPIKRFSNWEVQIYKADA